MGNIQNYIQPNDVTNDTNPKNYENEIPRYLPKIDRLEAEIIEKCNENNRIDEINNDYNKLITK